ncbi:bifunctional phosphopantothenoylcysteine decarboxylase/phosphopantothenate--cysteine ligase CoaBC [Deltaproteobacteria bacterium OttesenSCG-928-K17]|nr:bifunctional phosphopantothenoylcysteine decarboxylase/phosphopantothenate--cysteine ligase CoaBC [Deltaproteobacteria bacterium OttesenSCG-928-K17]
MSAPGNNDGSGRASVPIEGQTPLNYLAGRRLALVVTGGVAAYKAAELARMLVRSGAGVRAVLTENAARFITPLTFESLTGQPAYLDMWSRAQFEIEHISLADWAEAVVVAPATANFLAKMAHGLADDFASAFMLASAAPKLAAPAMNSRMLANQATADNLRVLAERGVTIIGSQTGLLACGTVGDGRLAELETIALMAARALGPNDFSGRRLAVSAGSTRESWDDIRFLANRSTGRMGLDIALAAWLRGAEVTVVAGPMVAPPPALPGLDFRVAESTRDMLAALMETEFQTLVMAAAPADFRPAERVYGKIKKGGSLPSLSLAANPDILKGLPRQSGRLYIGFAAEDGDLAARAAAKLKDKDLDLVAANQAGGEGGAFASADNNLHLVFKDGRVLEISPRPKFAAAWALLDAVKDLKPRA